MKPAGTAMLLAACGGAPAPVTSAEPDFDEVAPEMTVPYAALFVPGNEFSYRAKLEGVIFHDDGGEEPQSSYFDLACRVQSVQEQAPAKIAVVTCETGPDAPAMFHDTGIPGVYVATAAGLWRLDSRIESHMWVMSESIDTSAFDPALLDPTVMLMAATPVPFEREISEVQLALVLDRGLPCSERRDDHGTRRECFDGKRGIVRGSAAWRNDGNRAVVTFERR